MIKYKILIVDDEQGIVTMLRDYFEFHGYLVYTAMSGEYFTSRDPERNAVPLHWFFFANHRFAFGIH